MRRRRLFRYTLHANHIAIPIRAAPGMAIGGYRDQIPARASRVFEDGFAAGMRAAHSPSLADRHSARVNYTYFDLENARRRGFEEGRAVNNGPTRPKAVDASSIRKKAIDDMLESCRVIAESNPNMTSEAFFKAVQHRSKKL